MSNKTGIPWAEATINTHYGCTKVSAACENCYAERMTRRLAANPQTQHLTQDTIKPNGEWTGVVNVFPQRMEQVLSWKKPRMIFVNSMSDTFHENVPDEALYMIFAYMGLAPQHTFLVLTKRAERMMQFMNTLTSVGWKRRLQGALPARELQKAYTKIERPLENIWCGVTIENQAWANERIPYLLETPAAKHFVSIEPMLGWISLSSICCDNGFSLNSLISHHGSDEAPPWRALDWVICGTESLGNKAGRSPDFDAVRNLRDQCSEAGVPFFLKQLPDGTGKLIKEPELDGKKWLQYPEVRNGSV
jgi:protein gp37